MKVTSYQENFYQRIVDFGRHRPWVLLLGLIYFAISMVSLIDLTGLLIPEFNFNVIQFSLSLSAFLLLLSIGLFFLSNGYKPIWGVSFLGYAMIFITLSLNVSGFISLDITNPVLFNLWLFPVFIFISGMWIATSNLISENKKIIYLPSLFILIIGESWLLFGLLVLRDVELAIFGVLLGLVIPILMIFAYIWYRFGKDSIYTSPWYLSLGFLLMGLIYTVWNPWLNVVIGPIYYVLFALFNVALVLIFGGMITLSKDLSQVSITNE
ncbi:MAG: hypothetical protein ACFE95_09470 [Candidatus Hodarchaeota archaeon]